MAEVNVRIKAQNQTKTGFQQALRDAQGFSNSASGSMRTAFSGVASDIKSSIGGALAGLASFGAIRAIIDQFGRVQDLSEQFGVSAESIQRFGQLASEAGSSVEQVAAAFSRLTINIQKAQNDTSSQADALRELKLSASELANLSPEEAFLRLADALQRSGGSNSAYTAALELIGSRQRDLIPLLAQGSDAIRSQASAVSVASDEVVAKVDAMADRFQRLGQQLAVGFGPAIATIGQGILSVFATIQAAVDGIVGTVVQSVMGIGEVMKGNFSSGLSQIQSAPLENMVRVADDLRAKLAEINAAPPARPGRGMAAQLEAALEDQDNTRQGGTSGTRKGNVTGQQLGPGSIRGIEEAQREREAAARALGPEFGPGTAEAATGGFRVDAANFALQQREEALRIAQQQAQQSAVTGSFGASSLQRIGFASNEFFDTRRKEDPSKLMQQMVSEQKKTNKYLGDADGLYLQPSS